MKKTYIALFYLLIMNLFQALSAETLKYLENCNDGMKVARYNNDAPSYSTYEQKALDVIMNPSPHVHYNAETKFQQFDVCRRIMQQKVIVDKNKSKSSIQLSINDNNSVLHSDAGYEHYAVLAIMGMSSWLVCDYPEFYLQSNAYTCNVYQYFYEHRLQFFNDYIESKNIELYNGIKDHINKFSQAQFDYILGKEFTATLVDLSRAYPDVPPRTQKFIDLSLVINNRNAYYSHYDSSLIYHDLSDKERYVRLSKEKRIYLEKMPSAIFDGSEESKIKVEVSKDLYVTYEDYIKSFHDYIGELPTEIIVNIMGRLTGKDFANFRKTAHLFQNISQDIVFYLQPPLTSELFNSSWSDLQAKGSRSRSGMATLTNELFENKASFYADLINSEQGMNNYIKLNQYYCLGTYTPYLSKERPVKPYDGNIRNTNELILQSCNNCINSGGNIKDIVYINIMKFLIFTNNNLSNYSIYKSICDHLFKEYECDLLNFFKNDNEVSLNDNKADIANQSLNLLSVLHYCTSLAADDTQYQKAQQLLKLKNISNKSDSTSQSISRSLLKLIELHHEGYYWPDRQFEIDNYASCLNNISPWFFKSSYQTYSIPEASTGFLLGLYWTQYKNIESFNNALQEYIQFKTNKFIKKLKII